MSTEFELTRIGNRVVAVVDENLFSNAAAVALNNFVVVVDPLTKPADARSFRAKIEQHFNLPIKFLFVTHYHGDHALGVAPFKDTCIIGSTWLTQNIIARKKADWSPEALQKSLQKNPEEDAWWEDVEILLPTLSFEKGLEIRDEDLLLELHHTGGHTTCSAYAYSAHEKVIFAGDLMFAEQFPYAGDSGCNPDRWIESFKAWLALEFDTVIPGHGPLVGREEVEKHLHFFEALREAIKTTIQAGNSLEDVVVPDFYPPIEKDRWVKPETVEHWYSFYNK